MVYFIELTHLTSGQKCKLNPNHILTMLEANGERGVCTVISCAGEDERWIVVETVHEIENIINETEKRLTKLRK